MQSVVDRSVSMSERGFERKTKARTAEFLRYKWIKKPRIGYKSNLTKVGIGGTELSLSLMGG